MSRISSWAKALKGITAQNPAAVRHGIDERKAAAKVAEEAENQRLLQEMADEQGALDEQVLVDEIVPEGMEHGTDEALYESEQRRLAHEAEAPVDDITGVADDGTPLTGESVGDPELVGRTEERNTNFDYLATGQDPMAIIDYVAKANDGFRAQRRGKRTWEQTEQSGKGMKRSRVLTELMRRKPGDTMNAEQLDRARVLMIESAETLNMLGRDIEEMGGEASADMLYEYRRMEARHIALQGAVSGATTEVARAMNILKRTAQAGTLDYRSVVQQTLDEAGGPGIISKRARVIGKMTDPADVSTAMEASFWIKSAAAFRTWYINWGMLSGPPTHMANVGSNAVVAAVANPVEREVAALAGKMRRGITGNEAGVQHGEGVAQFYGLMRSTMEAWNLAGRAFISGESVFGSSRIDTAQAVTQTGAPDGSFKAMAGYVFGDINRTLTVVNELPGRALGAEDDFFKTWNFNGELSALAWRDAVESGKTGDEFAEHLSNILANPPPHWYAEAEEMAKYSTFTNQLGPIATKAHLAINAIPGSWVAIPFFKTIVNLFKWGVDRSNPLHLSAALPAGAPMTRTARELRQGYRPDATPAEQAAADMAAGRMTASALTLAGVSLAMMNRDEKGNWRPAITGGGPKNLKVKSVWRDMGWQEYSYLNPVTDEYVTMKRFDPWATQIGIIATAIEMTYLSSDEKAVGEIAYNVVGATADAMLNKQYLSGLQDLMDAINQRKDNSLARGWLSRFASTAGSPNIVKYARQGTDNLRRNVEADSLIGQIYARWANRVPGLSETLAPDTDVWGNVKPYSTIGPDWLSPLYLKQGHKDQATMALAAAQYKPGKLPKIVPIPGRGTSKGINSLDVAHENGRGWAYYDWRVMAGQEAHKMVSRLVSNKSFWDLPDGLNDEPGDTKRSLLRQTVSMARQKAAIKWYKAYKSQIDKKAQLVKNKRFSLMPPHITPDDIPVGPRELKRREEADEQTNEGFKF